MCQHLCFLLSDSDIHSELCARRFRNLILLQQTRQPAPKMLSGQLPFSLQGNQERAWFRGIVLSAALFEHFGSLILQRHLHSKVSNERLKSLTLERIIVFLRALNIISQPIYDKMLEIKDKRDDLAHKPFAELNPELAELLIRKAIQCLEYLKVADLSSS